MDAGNLTIALSGLAALSLVGLYLVGSGTRERRALKPIPVRSRRRGR